MKIMIIYIFDVNIKLNVECSKLGKIKVMLGEFILFWVLYII